MAGIDKTYVKNWNEYLEIQEWCKSVGTVTDVYGNTFNPIDYLWEYTEEEFKNCITEQINNVLERYHKGDYTKLVEEEYYTEEEVNEIPTNPMKYIGGFCIWNTPVFFDLWLIRNCPIQLIQERLAEQYGNINEIKNYQSEYDKFQRNGLGKNIKVVGQYLQHGLPYRLCKYDKVTYIDVELPELTFGDNNEFTARNYGVYRDDIQKWCYGIETCILDTNSSSSFYSIYDFLSDKALYRLLQKWDLPENTKVNITYKGSDNNFTYTIEKKLIIKKKK